MIKADHLTKRFGGFTAVDDVSFTVETGEVLGFLGPNGAGKSTSMRMLTGFLQCDGGSVQIGEHDMEKDPIAAKALIGYLPESAPLYGDMTVEGFLGFVGSLRGMSRASRRRAVDEVIETCFLGPVRHQSVDTLSKGYRHRTCFAQAILHDPPVLVLDEPTDGLDPNQKYEIRNLIKTMGERKAIILSTHILEEVDAVCSRVIVINRGVLVANGLPDELRARSRSTGSVLVGAAGQTAETLRPVLAVVPGAGAIETLPGGRTVRVVPADAAGAEGLAGRLAAACAQAHFTVEELHTERGRLDEVFRAITTGDSEPAPRTSASEVAP